MRERDIACPECRYCFQLLCGVEGPLGLGRDSWADTRVPPNLLVRVGSDKGCLEPFITRPAPGSPAA